MAIIGVPMTTLLQPVCVSRVRCPKCEKDVAVYSFCKNKHEIAGYKFSAHSYNVNVEDTSGEEVELRQFTLSCKHTDEVVTTKELSDAIKRKIAFPIVVPEKPLPSEQSPINGRPR